MARFNKESFEIMKKHRNLPFLERDMVIEVDGRRGIVKSGNSSNNLDVLFDGQKKTSNCHPHWKTKYFDADGNVLAEWVS